MGNRHDDRRSADHERKETTVLKRVIIGSFAIAVLLTPGLGADSESKKATTPPPSKFDPSASTVPPGFKGAKLEALFKRYAIVRGEFETKDEFEKRKTHLGSGIYAFQIQNTQPSYDVDSETMRLSIFADQLSTVSRGGIDRGWIIRTVSIAKGKYVGSTVGGGTRVVDSAVRLVYAISEANSPGYFDVTIPMDRRRAASVKPNLRLLVICELGPSSVPESLDEFGATGREQVEPTFHDPRDVLILQHVLTARVLAFWIYDERSGEVIGRYSPAGYAIVK
jgi:hypothetical protein